MKYTILKAVGLLLVIAVAFIQWVLPDLVSARMNSVVEHAPYKIRPDVQAFHDSLFIADLHADSLLWKRNLLKRSDVGHVDVPRMQAGNVALQVFSATTKSPKQLNYENNSADTDDITLLAVLGFWPPRTWNSLFERARFQLNKLDRFASQSDGELVVIRSASDFKNFVSQRDSGITVSAGLYLTEGAHPLEGKIENLDALFEQGLRITGLTHFFDNELGGSMHGHSKTGLTEFGRQVVKRSDELGLIIDVAHASPAMVRDVLDITQRPVILSHGGVKGLCDKQRNLSDELMHEIAQRGGLLGVGFWDGAVCDSTPQGIVRSIRYAIDLMGEKHVALGSDYDGAVTTRFDTSEVAVITQAMMDAGFSQKEIRLVMGENVKRFLLVNLPGSNLPGT